MPPKKKKPRPQRFKCDQVDGERFYAPAEDVQKYNWWEVFCFPYILYSRVWGCCVSLCSGTNQCLVYWMLIQWVVCKITKITTPDPITYPYFFYVFCQIFLITLVVILLWIYVGKSLLIPYIISFYRAFSDYEEPKKLSAANASTSSFRRYCFKKGDIFDTSLDKATSYAIVYSPNLILSFILDVLLYEVF